MRFAWLLLLPLLAACDSNPSAENEGAAAGTADPGAPADTAAALPTPDTSATKAVSAGRDTLRTVRQKHNFSNPKGPADLFKLVYRGPSILEGTGEFTITNPAGQVIFREMLSEADLEAALVYEMKNPTASHAEREAYVRRRIDQFFQPAQFHKPAIAPDAEFPADLVNLERATWDDLQHRPDAIGFDYLKGKEDRQRIAWAPLTKQVVRVQ